MASLQRTAVNVATNTLSQSNVILFCLIVAFIVFITLRGELPKYLAILFSSQGQPGSVLPQGDRTATPAEAAQDPIGALGGAFRRALGIENGLIPNLLR